MKKLKFITQEEYDQAIKAPITIKEYVKAEHDCPPC